MLIFITLLTLIFSPSPPPFLVVFSSSILSRIICKRWSLPMHFSFFLTPCIRNSSNIPILHPSYKQFIHIAFILSHFWLTFAFASGNLSGHFNIWIDQPMQIIWITYLRISSPFSPHIVDVFLQLSFCFFHGFSAFVQAWLGNYFYLTGQIRTLNRILLKTDNGSRWFPFQ